MKDFSKWLEAWENYPPVPDWMSTLDLAVVGIFGCAAILGLVIGIFGVSSYESGLGKIACISFAVGSIGILLGFLFSVFVNVYYEGKSFRTTHASRTDFHRLEFRRYRLRLPA